MEKLKFKNYDLTFGPSLNSSTNSVSEELSQDVGFALQVSITGTALNGTLKLQASNDNTNWADLSGYSTSVSALSGSATYVYNYDAAYFQYVRASWTNSSGTGSISVCKMCVKSL